MLLTPQHKIRLMTMCWTTHYTTHACYPLHKSIDKASETGRHTCKAPRRTASQQWGVISDQSKTSAFFKRACNRGKSVDGGIRYWFWYVSSNADVQPEIQIKSLMELGASFLHSTARAQRNNVESPWSPITWQFHWLTSVYSINFHMYS